MDISIIIPSWNSAKTLPRCLQSLTKQSFREFEVWIVDNGTTDFNAEKIQNEWTSLSIQIISLKENTGFAAASNLGSQQATGEWLAFLNADAFPYPDWLEQFMLSSQKYPQAAAFCSFITQFHHSDLVDGTGDVYNINGTAWKRGYGYPTYLAPAKPERVFSANAAAAFYRRDVFLEIGGFDEDFFSYFEDVDLGFRLNLYGHQCYFLPALRVEHVGSSSTGIESDFAVYYSHRNLEWTFIKNMPGILFFIYLPLHILGTFPYFLKYIILGRVNILFRAKLDAFKGIKTMFHKRKKIQANRRATLAEINSIFNKQLLAPFLLGYARRKFNKSRKTDTDF